MQYHTSMNRLSDFNIFSRLLSHLLFFCASLSLSLPCLSDSDIATPAATPGTTAPLMSDSPSAPAASGANPSAAPSSGNTAAATDSAPTQPPQSDALAGTAKPPDGAQPPDPVGPTDLWDRIRKGFVLSASDSPLVETHINWYAQRPEYVSRMVERSRRYLYHILGEVEKRGMPTEIALLPMVESAYNPMAYSTSHASGIWQFMPSTAKLFGLKQTGWYDGRRDIIAATDAALDYLTELHQQFGTWELALAAYNCGEGCVARAIAKNQARGLPTDYSSLSLPIETRHYVPKLLAIKQIVADPASVGLSLDSIPDQAYFIAVTLKQPIDVNLAAKLANMPVKDFVSLNPAYNQPVVRSDTPTQLLLPVDKADTFSNNLQNCTQPLVSWQMYKAKLGERVKTIAHKFDVSVAWLIEHNPIHLSHKGKLTRNQPLIVPLHSAVASASDRDGALAPPDKSTYPEASAMAEPVKVSYHEDAPRNPAPARIPERIEIKPGDTLYGIAKHYRISLQDLKKWNPSASTSLRPGATIRLAAPANRHKTRAQPARHKKPAKTASTGAKKTSAHKHHSRQRA